MLPCFERSQGDGGVCGSSRGWTATLEKLRAILILPHQHWEDVRSLLIFLRNMLQWSPWNTVFSKSPLIRSLSRSYLMCQESVQESKTFDVTFLHFISIASYHVVMKLKNRKEPKQTHVFNSSCHQHSVKLSKTKNSRLSQIENLLAAKIH